MTAKATAKQRKTLITPEPAQPPAPVAADETRWWAYPLRWVLTEKFWMEVTTRTVSGIIAGVVVFLIGYVVALILGYLGAPTGWHLVSLATSALAMMFTFGAFVRWVFGMRRHLGPGKKSSRFHLGTLGIAAVGACFAILAAKVNDL